MGRVRSTQNLIVGVLVDGRPRSSRDLVHLTGLPRNALWEGLRRCWANGLVLRSVKPFYESEVLNKGRAGRPRNIRPYHLYTIRPEGKDELILDGRKLVRYDPRYRDVRGGNGDSKAQAILGFLEVNSDKAFFSTQIVDTLTDRGVKPEDVMSNVRRFERKGLVYVRGYRGHDRSSPFRDGYLLTWVDRTKDPDTALLEAIQRTDQALMGRESTNPILERVHRVRNLILEATSQKDICFFTYIRNALDCSEMEAEGAINRALQLYPDLRELKLFDAYRYYYHTSLTEIDLNAAVELKKNYVRLVGGRRYRVGHNWEAVPEWFIDQFTKGAEFESQQHRNTMDPRRITLHLVKSVKGRRNVAEVDRVWTVSSGPFTPAVTNVLSCKWGLIRKDDLDDFLDVLKYSKEFGVDTQEGRQVRQGIMGVFAGGAFNPRENVTMKDETTVSLPTYAQRLNIQLLKASDFDDKLRERGCPEKATVRRICRIARNEREVRDLLDRVWKDPENAENVLSKIESANQELYDFEKRLDDTSASSKKPLDHALDLPSKTSTVVVTQHDQIPPTQR